MRYEVQVHFENKGSITWFEDIHCASEYEDWFFCPLGRVYCQGEDGRHYFIRLDTVIALVLTESPLNKQENPNATKKRNEPQNDIREYTNGAP